MARVVDLESQKIERIARELLPVLERDDYAWADVRNVDVDRWRAAARRAARMIGRRVRTGIATGGEVVWAALTETDEHRREM